VIKAAAIRCRYCGSDLESAEPIEPIEPPEPAERAEVPEDAEAGDESAEALGRSIDQGFLAHRRKLTGPFLAIPLVGLVVALVLVLLLAIVPHVRDDGSKGEQISDATRAVLMDQAAKMTATALSYSAKTFDADTAAAGKLMTSSMRKQYVDTLAQVKDEVAKEGLVLKAEVVASALVSATSDEARVLEFVNQSTTAKGVKRTQVNQNRVVVTLTQTDGRWLISKMDAF
jgi:Mce-associated membrane protein